MVKKNVIKKFTVILSCLLVLLIAASVAGCGDNNPGEVSSDPPISSASEEVKFQKHITIRVIANDQEYEFGYDTDAEFLRQALEDKDLIKGDESEFGLFITEVYGIKADSDKRQWWCITKGGQAVMTGADTTPIANGDTFELTLSTY